MESKKQLLVATWRDLLSSNVTRKALSDPDSLTYDDLVVNLHMYERLETAVRLVSDINGYNAEPSLEEEVTIPEEELLPEGSVRYASFVEWQQAGYVRTRSGHTLHSADNPLHRMFGFVDLSDNTFHFVACWKTRQETNSTVQQLLLSVPGRQKLFTLSPEDLLKEIPGE